MKKDLAYSYMHDILTDGFISLGVRHKDFRITLKSLTDIEANNLLAMHASPSFDAVPIIDRLLYAVRSFNGVDILSNRRDALPILRKKLNSMPNDIVKWLASKADFLFIEFSRASVFLEGFSYTAQSRELWSIYKNTRLGNDPTFVSLKNSVRDRWVAINSILDAEDTNKSDTDLAMFVASSMNPEGVKKVQQSLKRHRDDIDSRRKEIAGYGNSLKLLRLKKKKEENRWAPALETKEDLVRELNRVARGDKDKHDLFIERYLAEEQARKDRLAEERRRKAAEFRKKFKEESHLKSATRRATAEDIERIENGYKSSVYEGPSAYERFDRSKEERLDKIVGSRVLKKKG